MQEMLLHLNTFTRSGPSGTYMLATHTYYDFFFFIDSASADLGPDLSTSHRTAYCKGEPAVWEGNKHGSSVPQQSLFDSD